MVVVEPAEFVLVSVVYSVFVTGFVIVWTVLVFITVIKFVEVNVSIIADPSVFVRVLVIYCMPVVG